MGPHKDIYIIDLSKDAVIFKLRLISGRETNSRDAAFPVIFMALGRGICEHQEGQLEAVSNFFFFLPWV